MSSAGQIGVGQVATTIMCNMQADDPPIPRHIVARIAAESMTDRRTVLRVVVGRPTRPATRERVLLAAAALSIQLPNAGDATS